MNETIEQAAPLTAEQRAELLRLASEAPDAPWRADEAEDNYCQVRSGDGSEAAPHSRIGEVADDCADLVVAMRNALPSLLEAATPSEAIFAFAAWLTCRDEELTLSGHHDAAPIVRLVAAFNESQGFAPPRDDYHTRLKPYPR